jgi:DNA-binding CsgD family transcriptional regulator
LFTLRYRCGIVIYRIEITHFRFIILANQIDCLKSAYSILVLILLGYSSRAQSPYQNLLSRTFAERAAILLDFYHGTVYNGDSVHIFQKIDSIAQLARDNKDQDLLLETALMRAHYFYYRDTIFSRAFILEKLDNLKQLAIEKKSFWLEIMAENMMALYNYNRQYYQQAFVHHQRVYHLIKDIDPEVFPQKQNCLLQMGMEYYHFNDFPESIFYIRQALYAEPKSRMAFFRPRLSLLNTIGLAYQKMNNLDSADHYFRFTIQEAVKQNDIVWECIASGNLGYSYFLRREFDKAIPLLEKDVRNALLTNDPGLASGSQMILGAISLEQKNTAKAWEQLQLARQLAYASTQYSRLQTLYPLLSKLYAAKGMPGESALFLDSAMVVKDSLSRAFNALLLLRARQQVEMERYNAEMEGIRSQQKINILERNILIAVVLLLMGIAVLIYRAQQKKNELQKERAQKASEELMVASRQLTDFAKNISEKNAMIEMLQTQNGNETTEALEKLQHSTILTDEDWEYFRGMFEKVHQGFLQRLKQKEPNLTPAETRFMVLTKLGLSAKVMAATLGIGADAIRQLRSRVRRKLNLGEEANLDEWVAGV